MREHVNRLVELYRDGGIQEVERGVTDYIVLNTGFPFHRLLKNGTFTIGGVSVDIRIESNQSIWRLDGHGEKVMYEDYVERVTPDSIVWDVGSNIGTYSLLGAELGATVIAFEPSLDARHALERNAELNGYLSIRAIGVALSNEYGTRTLSNEGLRGDRSIAESDRGTRVDCAPGDEIVAERPDIIKIDVEGHEREVIDGMPEVLDNASTVYIEVHEGVPRMNVLTRLWDAGYKVTETWNERENETHYRLDK